MRFLFTVLLVGSLAAALPSAAQHGSPGYHMPKRLHNAQQYSYRRPPLRLTFGVNLATYNGDITSRLQDNTLRVGFGVGLVRPLSPHLSAVAELSYNKLQAVDQIPDRGLRFTGTNGVLTVLARYNFLADKSMNFGPSFSTDSWQPFVEAGVGALLYDPVASLEYSGMTIVLPPERRNSNYLYPHLGAVLPVGGGVTYRLNPYFALTLEGLYYFTSTDLLDDVSERANSKTLDKFATGTFKLEFGLRPSKKKPLVHFD
ncbi:MAG: hypothetical protein EOO36_16025 [Cytophagaceae bacterium]|nr:MAG: hypothetical protein EOO36_16025 [Cytophagaceae bacterium]